MQLDLHIVAAGSPSTTGINIYPADQNTPKAWNLRQNKQKTTWESPQPILTESKIQCMQCKLI